MREFARALCLTALSDDIALPQNPDPTGLPKWNNWIEDQLLYSVTTSDLEDVPSLERIDKVETDSHSDRSPNRRSRVSLTIRIMAICLFVITIGIVWAWDMIDIRISPKSAVKQADSSKAHRQTKSSVRFSIPFTNGSNATTPPGKSIDTNNITRSFVEKDASGAMTIERDEKKRKRTVRPQKVRSAMAGSKPNKTRSRIAQPRVTENQNTTAPPFSATDSERIPPPVTTW